jgi:glycosyltransferase involved in cell wall biosynthesis
VHGPYSVNRYSAIMVRGERVIAISEWIRRYVLDNYPQVDPGRVSVIPRGVDPGEFVYGHQPDNAWRASFFEAFPAAAGRRVLTLPARLSRRKGQTDFIKLIAGLVGAGLPVHGVVVGGAGARRAAFADELVRMCSDLGIADRVSFTGSRRDIREIMSISDIVLSLSLEPEGFGRTTVEALSLGRPVIGYRHSGIAEVLGRAYPQGLVANGDLTQLAERVKAFLQAPPPVPAHHPYTLQAMLDSTLSLYQSLSGER